MADCMSFPKEPMDFIKGYSFVDSDEVYTNGSELVPLFRVEQMLEHYLNPLMDKQEQGLLIELPCKVGDYAWDLIAHYRFEIVSIVINSCGNIFFKCGNKGTEDYASFSIEDIGDTWMITEPKESDYWNPRSEAEEALAKMGGK